MPAYGYQGYYPQAFQQPQGLTGRMVTSREEANAYPADFSGNPIFLPDLGHSVIYVKRFDPNTGLSTLFEFKLAPAEAPEPAWAADIRALTERIEKLEKGESV